MSGRKLGVVFLCLVIAAIAYSLKLGKQSETSDDVQAAMRTWIEDMPSYQEHALALNSMADLAHQRAFDRTYSIGSRYRSATFDKQAYVRAFFDDMMSQAIQRKLRDIAEELKQCKAECLAQVRATDG